MTTSGSNKTNIIAGLFTGVNFEKLTVSNSVKILTASKYTSGEFKAKRAFITVETASFRYKYNGDNPTTSEGHIARPNSVITLIGTTNIENFKAIRISSNATVQITYEF